MNGQFDHNTMSRWLQRDPNNYTWYIDSIGDNNKPAIKLFSGYFGLKDFHSVNFLKLILKYFEKHPHPPLGPGGRIQLPVFKTKKCAQMKQGHATHCIIAA